MTDYKLENIDIEDIELVLQKVEDTFEFRFVSNELINVTNFGELSDAIMNKITLEHKQSCTTQQAFYKLNKVLTSEFGLNGISPKTELSIIFPKNKRLKLIQKVERELNFKLSITEPKRIYTNLLLILFAISILSFFYDYKIALIGIGISVFGIWITHKFGKELNLKTVGDLAKKMKRENYLKSRRNPESVNKNEIEQIIIDLFSIELDLDKSELTRSALI
jgi:positive regulator of sigma E activity